MSFIAQHIRHAFTDKQTNVVIFSATAIALYGYDQGMMVSSGIFLCVWGTC